jgi:hypothetical protein
MSAIKLGQINGIGVGFAKDDIRFAWVYSLLGSKSTNNQIIQAITMLSSVKPTAQQSTCLLLPVAQEGLLLTVRMWMMLVAASPPQAMSTAMAWMI